MVLAQNAVSWTELSINDIYIFTEIEEFKDILRTIQRP